MTVTIPTCDLRHLSLPLVPFLLDRKTIHMYSIIAIITLLGEGVLKRKIVKRALFFLSRVGCAQKHGWCKW